MQIRKWKREGYEESYVFPNTPRQNEIQKNKSNFCFYDPRKGDLKPHKALCLGTCVVTNPTPNPLSRDRRVRP